MPEKVLTATIYAVGKTFEEDPKAVHVHAEIENGKGDLISGIYVQGRIITDEAETLAIPEGGVVTEGGRSYIFLLAGQQAHADEHVEDDGEHEEQTDGKAFRMVEVGPGITEYGFVEIKPRTDLSVIVKVVTAGADYILAEMKKGEAYLIN